MAFYQVDFSNFFNMLEQDSNQFDQIQNRFTQTKQNIQDRLHQILQTNFNNLIRESNQLTDISEVLENILTFSKQLSCQFEQSPKLKQKLRDIEEEINNYFQQKQAFQEILQDYKESFTHHSIKKKSLENINQKDLAKEETLNNLYEYAFLTKKLADYSTFLNDLNDLKKMEERFKMFESEEDYLEYQIIANNKTYDQIIVKQTQSICHYIQMLGQSIKNLKSHQTCPILIQVVGNENINEELIFQYQYTIFLKIDDDKPALIMIDKKQSNAQIICLTQNRLQIKEYLQKNFQNYLRNVTINYMLLKMEYLLEQIYQKTIEKLIQINLIYQFGNLTFEEMLKSIQKILLYQQDLQELDCFQFLDEMKIELN